MIQYRKNWLVVSVFCFAIFIFIKAKEIYISFFDGKYRMTFTTGAILCRFNIEVQKHNINVLNTKSKLAIITSVQDNT